MLGLIKESKYHNELSPCATCHHLVRALECKLGLGILSQKIGLEACLIS